MKYKLVCFDLDGTVIDDTVFIWQTIHDYLKTDKEKRKKAAEDFTNKKITYKQWAEHDLELWKEKNATKQDLIEAIKPLKLMHGALETLNKLKKSGLKLAVISGSLNIALDKVLPNHTEIFDDIYINHLIFKGDKIKEIKSTTFDFEHKAAALQEICKKENISPEECVFIGDHNNDIQIAELAGLSIAFNCKSERLAEVADIVIKEKDLTLILPHILK
jgi:HAD superfamily PSPase-like hydrolase